MQGKNRSMVISLNGAFVQRSFVLLSLGTALILILVGLLFITKVGTVISSQNIRKMTVSLSDQMISHALAQEIPYLTAKEGDKDDEISLTGTMFNLLTGIDPKDPRTLLGRELPGFSLFDTNVLVAGKDVGIGDLPVETTPPVEALQNQPVNEQTKVENPVEETFNTNGKKVVFIYNTHNRESWISEVPEASKNVDLAFHPTKNMTLVSDHFARELEKNGIGAQVSKVDIFSKLQQKKLSYSLSYSESRKTVQEVMARNKDLTYFVDIHRDSLPRKNTTIHIDGVDYARVYFIIGMRNKNWTKNEQFALQIHNELKKKLPGLSKGIYGKNSGNAEYNQSVSPNSILIEIGGPENTLEECQRTADVLAEAFSKVFWEAEKVNSNKPGDMKRS
ncbi:MAG TPA: stage II sporulation protein P [Paenibacillaceae bacterium]|nr:stage II sporulation protein P [Paenibacillaceae bacterium]